MEFRTPAGIRPYGFKIGYGTRGMLAGSCFAENIAAKMTQAKLPVSANPFGVLFNPASIVNMFGRLNERHTYSSGDLTESGGVWISMEHHGKFSSPDREEALRNINGAVREGADALALAQYVIITLGTAWVYEYIETGTVAANCHKLPAALFDRRRLTVGEIVEMFEAPLRSYLKDKQVIFTVSPVRHLKDGLAENQLSKATLIVAAHEIVARHGNCSYFPAYEIVVDDLRDYRFYNADMVHPSPVAVEYIWEHFCDAFMDRETVGLIKQVGQIAAAAGHRPLNQGSPVHKAFREKMLEQVRRMAAEHPEIDFNPEIKLFTE